jgi:hypothetical protein
MKGVNESLLKKTWDAFKWSATEEGVSSHEEMHMCISGTLKTGNTEDVYNCVSSQLTTASTCAYVAQAHLLCSHLSFLLCDKRTTARLNARGKESHGNYSSNNTYPPSQHMLLSHCTWDRQTHAIRDYSKLPPWPHPLIHSV